MTVSLEEKMRELSPAQRRRVLARAAEIRAEVLAVRPGARTQAGARSNREDAQDDTGWGCASREAE